MLDVSLAILLLGLCGLPMLLVALCILIESGRPVLFRQVRAGRFGRPFEILKFRSLHPAPHRVTDPSRVATRVGSLLRRSGLDELPQLWNILRGEMSFVGPRPTLPEQVARYSAFERRRLQVLPGITGWAQVHGRNALSWPERIRLDVEYVERACLSLDLKILARTIPVVLSGTGTYGSQNRNPDFLPSDHDPLVLPKHLHDP